MADHKISADDDYGNNPDMSTNVEEMQEVGKTDGGYGTDSYSAAADSPDPSARTDATNGDTLEYSPVADVPDDEQALDDIDPVTGTRESMGSDTNVVLPPDVDGRDLE